MYSSSSDSICRRRSIAVSAAMDQYTNYIQSRYSLVWICYHFEEFVMSESHLPYDQQSLIYRLRKRAEIRRQISTRKSVQQGEPDRLADLLEEAANELEMLLDKQ